MTPIGNMQNIVTDDTQLSPAGQPYLTRRDPTQLHATPIVGVVAAGFSVPT